MTLYYDPSVLLIDYRLYGLMFISELSSEEAHRPVYVLEWIKET
jgi:hypothetical protein